MILGASVPRCLGASLFAALVLSGCSHGPKPEETAPATPPSPPQPAAMITPSSAAGAYRIRPEIQTGNKPPQQRSGSQPQASMTLSSEPAAVPVMGAPSGMQFNATISLPGYSHAARGRSGQSAAWWPIGGDSMVVQFSQGSGGDVQLRGALKSGGVSGDIWYVSSSSGSTFQLGTFTASKSAPSSHRTH
jgi:hypothetical protein